MNEISFRVVFGLTRAAPIDYSGAVSLSEGKVLRVEPWRFFGGDAMEDGSRWKLTIKTAAFENQPDKPTQGGVKNTVPAGIVVTAEAPLSAAARIRTAQGDIEFRLQELAGGRVLEFGEGDISVQRTPSVRQVSPPAGMSKAEHDYPSVAVTRAGAVWVAWQAYEGGGDSVYVRHAASSTWSEPFRLAAKADVYRTAVAEDARGRVWAVWSERAGEDWDLYARVYDGRSWSPRRKLTTEDSPNFSHRLAADPSGALHMVWVGHRGGESHVFWSRLEGEQWSAPREVSGAGAWTPQIAFDSRGGAYIAWDSYRGGNYDIFLRRIAPGGRMLPMEQVTRSAAFQAHASIAVDKRDRVWLAWDESDANWGKDFWNKDPNPRGAGLYTRRRPRIVMFAGGVWKEPANILEAAPARHGRYIQLPQIVCDRTGRIWVAVQVRTAAGTNRVDNWANNGQWERYLTTLDGNRWSPFMPLASSSSRPEGPFDMQAAPGGIWMTWAKDNRTVFGGKARESVSEPSFYEVNAAFVANEAPPPEPALADYVEPVPPPASLHPNEAADVARVRQYRTDGGPVYRIVRGDFHRHTEISYDGAGDGSLEDYARYMLDAAAMDTGIIADHNAGGTDYGWWRTQKTIDLYYIKKRFTPLFGYERSVRYPNGHRNVVFAQRGVPVLAISAEEQRGRKNTGPILYPYLRQYRGICMAHSLATPQGTDFRDNDPEVEPLVEIYQGYRTNYEYDGAPRGLAGEKAHSAGFYWSALERGYKLGVHSSSDHVSTHTSYTMIYTPEATRTAIVESMRKRRAYGATDNILLDYRAVDERGAVHFMGEAFDSRAAPKFVVKAAGTAPIAKIEIVRDGKFVFQTNPADRNAQFTWMDNEPRRGTSWYYVRVMQADGNLAWSSPVWVRMPR
ncbi:MAG: DUF3604 domain-containing protein [Bryobacteraceae bacterium]